MVALLQGVRRTLLSSQRKSIGQRILSTQAANLIFYVPMQETSGTTADDVSTTNANCTYVGSPLLGQSGIGDGSASVKLDGTTAQRITVPVATLDTPFDPTVGTLLIWGRVASAGIWTDGTLDCLCEFGTGVSGRLLLNKATTNNTIQIQWIDSVGTKQFSNGSFTSTNWFSLCVKWSAANGVDGFLNGVVLGTNQTYAAWTATTPLSNSWTAIGDYISTGNSPWNGWLAHCAIWNVRLSNSEIAAIATP
jgi:hypothetical protein